MATGSAGAAHGLDGPGLGALAEDRGALDYLFSVTYEELRRLATSVRRRDPAATLSPTALVNEAWLKLAASPPMVMSSRLHFKRIAARSTRRWSRWRASARVRRRWSRVASSAAST